MSLNLGALIVGALATAAVATAVAALAAGGFSAIAGGAGTFFTNSFLASTVLGAVTPALPKRPADVNS